MPQKKAEENPRWTGHTEYMPGYRVSPAIAVEFDAARKKLGLRYRDIMEAAMESIIAQAATGAESEGKENA